MNKSAGTGGGEIPYGRIPYINPSVQPGSEAEVPLRETRGVGTALKAGAPVKFGTPAAMKMKTKEADPDEAKGAVEDDAPRNESVKNGSNNSMSGQMGHRNKPAGFEDSDSDYPEPESSGEHSGQK